MTDAEATTPAEKADDSVSATTLEKEATTTESEKSQEHEPVYGPIEDELFGKRIRKSFGSRAFWGTIVTSYVVGRGVFYKVSFDDGDVDIFSTGEVLQDLDATKRYADQDPCAKQSEVEIAVTTEATTSSSERSSYVDAVRTKTSSLKRPRDGGDSETAEERPPVGAWQVKLWSTRLFATIMEEEGYICLHEFVPMPSGQPGEMESTGKVKPGDALVAVLGRVVHGRMDHTQACDLIRAAPRPVTLTFIRPPVGDDPASSAAVDAAIEAIRESSTVSTSVLSGSDAGRKKARVDTQGSSSASTETPSKARPSSEATTAPRSSTPPTENAHARDPSRDPKVRSGPPTPEVQLTGENQSAPPANPLHGQDHVSTVAQPPRGISRTPSPPVEISTFPASSTGSIVAFQPHHSSASEHNQPHHRPPRTRSPAPPVNGVVADYNSQQSSNTMAYRPPRQNTAHLSGSNQLQTVFIPAHLASSASTQLSSTGNRYFAPGSMSAPMSQSGPQVYRPQQVPVNERRNGGVPTTHSNSMIGVGFQRYDHSSRALFAPTSEYVMRQRDGANSSSHMTGTSMPSYDQRPSSSTTAMQDLRHSYPRQQYLANPRHLGHTGNAPHQSLVPASNFQRLPVRRSEQLSSDDEQSQNMTLGDYMVFTAQQERQALRAAAQQQSFSRARPASQPQLTSSSITSREPVASLPPSTRAANPRQQEGSPKPAPDEPSSFLSLKSVAGEAAGDTTASTGTSFLSLNQTSFLEDIPVNVRAKASRVRDGFRKATAPSHNSRPRPPYLEKYGADSLVEVVITQPRLYLTLAPLGQYVSISSFVRGDSGEVGEIEASGKVLAGDVLVGVGSIQISPFTSPGEVARIVNSQPRPYSAYFIRATWEMLE